MMSKAASKMMQGEPRDVAIEGGRSLAVRIWGSLKKAARPQEHWIALHGHGSDSDTLDCHIAPLVISKGAAAVVCIDMGLHDSEDAEAFANDVLATADALGWDRFSVLSHSPEAALVSQHLCAISTDRVTLVIPLEAHHAHLTDPRAVEKAVEEELEHEEEEEAFRAHPVPNSLNAWSEIYFALCPKDLHVNDHLLIESGEYHDVWFARTMSDFEVM